jgi:signal transduction histidine kinase
MNNNVDDTFKTILNKEILKTKINGARLVSFLGIFIVPFFSLSGIDYLFTHSKWLLFFQIRMIIALLCLCIYILVKKNRFEKYAYCFSTIVYLSVGWGICIMIRYLGYESPYYAGLNLVYLGTIAAFYDARMTFLVCILIYSGYLIPILIYDSIDYKIFIANNEFQLFTIILITIFNHFLHKSRTTEILNRLTIQKQSDELKKQEDEKRQFIANITHDLKTPLSIITGHTEILRESFSPDTTESKYLDYIGNSILQINRLLDMLISMALLNKKDEKPKLELYNYPLFIKTFCNHFHVHGGNRGISFTTDIPDEKTVVAIDQIWTERILGNLIQNSFKFTNPGGSIKVRVYKDNEFIYTEVIDTGAGIPEDKLKLVFERNYQAHDDKKHLGYGLGLTIVKEMVTRLGGAIEAISKVNHGTTMRFSLPVHCDQFAAVNNSAEIRTDRRSGVDRRQESRIKLIQEQIEHDTISEKIKIDISQFENKSPSLPTILICEDNHGQLHLLIEGLKQFYNLIIAENGKIGLSKLEQYSTKISLIISDVRMPEMDGLEFCKQVTSNDKYKHLPFIFLTSYTNNKEQLEGLSYGATDYLQKPFNRSILIEKLNHWLSRRQHELVLENLVTTLETKNQEIGKLRSIIGHEIRNPLMILNGVQYKMNKLKIRFLESSTEKEIGYWNSLDDIVRVITTINGVLESAKVIESGLINSSIRKELVTTLLNLAVEETAHLMNTVKLSIKNTLAADEYVLCDSQLLTQVFVNLIRNAKEAIDEAHNENGQITIDILKTNKLVYFGVTDDGAGIPAERINNLFQYHYTTKKDGTGIGLYFSKKILKIHEGDITVESTVGKGTTFTVILPQDMPGSR